MFYTIFKYAPYQRATVVLGIKSNVVLVHLGMLAK
jgi:hypothetical protein